MVIDFRRKRMDTQTLNILGEDIKMVEDCKYLGVHIHSKLNKGTNTEAVYRSQNPQINTVERKNSLLTGRNLEQDPAYREEPSC